MQYCMPRGGTIARGLGDDSRSDLRGARRVIAVDTNILVYAHREDSEWYDRASAAVAGLAEGGHLDLAGWRTRSGSGCGHFWIIARVRGL